MSSHYTVTCIWISYTCI